MNQHPSRDPQQTLDHTPITAPPSTIEVTGDLLSTHDARPKAADPTVGIPEIPGYAVTFEIAKGGMGRVYAARELHLDREVAIKTLLPKSNPDRFIKEAKITARLPHPGIPPVHSLGILADGTPYLAMKLVRGHTLAELLRERGSHQVDLPRFVQIFEQVAQAVGFAHSQGIIHRDLKPQNIMVGAFGEVQVMDWGLAKESTAESPSSASEAGNFDDANLTFDGAILGTPGYMSPEQARGEPVDARTDVFALGSILAAILTGMPCFVGSTARETIGKAARADLTEVSARLATCGSDPRLVELARRYLVVRADQRPGDARTVADEVAAYRADVAARLRQAETEQAEALVRENESRRRHRLLRVSVGTVLAVLVGGLGASLWQMNRAIVAEGQAKANEQRANTDRDAKARALESLKLARASETQARNRAFTALRTMTDDFVEQQMARGQKLTDENKKFLGDIIEQFDAFASIKAEDADSRSIRGEGRFRVGQMRDHLGEAKEAEAAYLEALDIQKKLAADFPADPEIRARLAVYHNNFGLLVKRDGRVAQAEAALNEAIRLKRVLVAEHPERSDYRRELAGTCHNLVTLLRETGRLKEAETILKETVAQQKELAGDGPVREDLYREVAGGHYNLGLLFHETGRLKEAEAAYLEARTGQLKLVSQVPASIVYRQDLAMTHNSLGLLFNATGRPQEAEESFADALAIQQQLADEFPARPEYRMDLAITHNNLGNSLRDEGKVKEAEQSYLKVVEIEEQLVAANASNLDYRHALSTGYQNLGRWYRDAGRLADAESAFDKALALRRALVDGAPSRTEFRAELASSLAAQGTMLSDAGRLKEAEDVFAEALKLQKQLAGEFPSVPEYRQKLALALNSLAGLLRDDGRTGEAVKTWQEALSLQEQLTSEHPSQPEMRYEWGVCQRNLASLLRDLNQLPAAEEAYLKALDIQAQLASDFPKRPEFREELASVCLSLGNLRRATNQLTSAVECYTEALGIQQQLAAEFPKLPKYRRALAGIHNNLGAIHFARNKLEEGEAAWRAALALQTQLAADLPNRPEVRMELATTYNNLGAVLRATDRKAEAEAAWRESLKIRAQLVTDFPTRPEFRQNLASGQANLGVLLRETGRLADAEKAYLEALAIRKALAAEFSDQPEMLSSLAGNYVNLAVLCNHRGDYAAAKSYLDEGQPHHAAALAANGKHPEFRQNYRLHVSALTAALAGLLQPEEAVRTSAEYRELGWPTANYDSAVALAACIPIVKEHPKLAEEERERAVKFYGDAALKPLRAAVESKIVDLKRLQSDPYFAAIREREDYQQLMAGLEDK